MPALSNVALTDTFDAWRVRTNQVIVKGNVEEIKVTDAYDKANSANLLAYNTGIGTNTYILATIAGANTAVGAGANTYLLATIAGANTAVGVGANTYLLATIAGANTAVGVGANTYLLATIAGANSVVGTSANAFTSATVSGANTIAIAAFNKANAALANTTGTFVGNLTITGNVAVTGNSFTVGGNNISPVQSFRNKIINGNFDFWQRGTSNTAQGYLADRFRTQNTGSTFTTSQQTFTAGQTDVPGEPRYFHRTVVTTSAAAGNFCNVLHPIESVRTAAGKTMTLSFYAKADTSKNIAIELQQNFGTGGSPSSSVSTPAATVTALTSTFAKYTITFTVPSISGKTLGTNNDDYLGLLFWFDAGSTYNSRTNTLGQQSGTFDISQIQFEEGSVATPFEMRPYATELSLCQRYCQRYGDSTSVAFPAYNTTGSAAYYTTALVQEMRGTPTFTKFGTWNVSNCGQPSFSGNKNVMSGTAVITSTGTCLFWAGTNLYVLLSAEF